MKLTDVLRSKARAETTDTAASGLNQGAGSGAFAHPFDSYQSISTAHVLRRRGIRRAGPIYRGAWVLHPIVVRRSQVGYELVVGERRLRACRMLGFETIPAVVRELSDKQAGNWP